MKVSLMALFGALALLALAVMVNSRLLIIMACVVASLNFFVMVREAFADYPRFDFARMFAGTTGLFYFLGALPVNIALLFDPDYVSFYVWKQYRSYEPRDLAVAGVLVLLCSVPLILTNIRLSPPMLRRLWAPLNFHAGAVEPARREEAAIGRFLILLAALTVLMLASGSLSVDFNPVAAVAGRGQTSVYLIVFLGCQAALPMAALMIVRGWRAGRLPLFWCFIALVLLVGLFTMGRRPLLAGLVSAGLFTFYIMGWRISVRAWIGLAIAALLVFSLVTIPFAQIRASMPSKTAGGGAVSAGDFLSPDAIARRSALARPTMANLTNITIMRFDLLGELAEVVRRYPLDRVWLGSGMATQFAVMVPGAIWPEKKDFLLLNTMRDERILEIAGLPPTDIAGTSTLFAYAEGGWFAPLVVLFQFWLYLAVTGLIVRSFNSFAVWLLAYGSVLSSILQPDAFNFSAMLFSSVYLLVFAFAMTACGLFRLPGTVSQAPIHAIGRVARPKNQYPGLSVSRPGRR